MLDILDISTTSSKNNHLSTHEKNIIKKNKNMGDQNPYVNKIDT